MTRKRRTAPPARNAARTASTPTTEVLPQSTAKLHAALMAAVTDRLAPTVVTEVRDPDDVTDVRYRARTYLTLRAAERAVLAAWDRGQRAEVVLVRLVPVQIGGEL